MDDATDAHQLYRTVIDRLVRACQEGQGQIAGKRALDGLWNANATAEQFREQHEVNLLLARLSKEDREVLARMLEEAFQGGVGSTLATLHEVELPPFDKAYEGTPVHDFVGRLDGWKWPQSSSRS